MTRAAALLSIVLAAACSGGPELRPEADPALEAHGREMQKEDEKRRDFNAVLVRLDQAMDSYVQALANRGEARADAHAERLEKLIGETVLDQSRTGVDGTARGADEPPGENFRRLVALAKDGTIPDHQAIALAALGFSGKSEVMPTIVQGAMLSDPFRADRAVLGLAVLRAPDTPPGVLAAIVERDSHPEDGRVQAAWALYRLQEVLVDQSPIVAIWQRFLTNERDRLPVGVLVTAVRGLGLTHDARHADLVAQFTKHPTPRLRMAAAIALGRMNAQSHWEDLLALLGPQETVQNVRLAARTALGDLAGNQDYGYDVTAWRKVFDRGR